MVKYLISILFLLASLTALPQQTTIMKVQTLSQMQAHKGSQTFVHVASTNELYDTCESCTVNGTTVFGGTGGSTRKWKKVSDADKVSASNLKTLNGQQLTGSGNIVIDINGKTDLNKSIADSTMFANAIGLKADASHTHGIDGVNDLVDSLRSKLDTSQRPRISAGSGITITGTYPNITITSTGGGGTVTGITATDNYAQAWTITNPTTAPNLSLLIDTLKIGTRGWIKKKTDSVSALIPTNNNQLSNGAGYKLNSDTVNATGYRTIYSANKARDSLAALIPVNVKSNSDSVAPTGYKTIYSANKTRDSLAALIPTNVKNNADSVAATGYKTVYSANKTRDSLAALITAISGGGKANNDTVALTGYTTVYRTNKIRDSLGAMIPTNVKSNADSINATGYKTVYSSNKTRDSLAALIPTNVKSNSDSITATGYKTVYSANKTRDSLAALIPANVKSNADSVTSTGYKTVYSANKFRDSLAALIPVNVKSNADSITSTGYKTVYSANKMRDSIAALIPTNVKNNADSITATGYKTVYSANKFRDSLGALINAYTLGGIRYGSGTNTFTELAGNTTSTKKFLTQTGTGSVPAAPAWSTIAAADVPTLNQNTTGSAATLGTARTINGVSFDGSANITITADATTLTGTSLKSTVVGSSLTSTGTITSGTWNGTPTQNSLNIYKALGGNIKAEPVALTLGNLTNNGTLSSQGMRFVAVWLPQAATVSGVAWVQTTNGSYTANNYNGVGLYTYNAGTLTLVASSTNDGTVWSQGTGLITKDFSGTYSAQPGLYFIGALYSSSAQTQAPVLSGGAAIPLSSITSADFTNNAKFASSIASQTALPNPIASSTLAITTTNYYFALY